MCTPDLVSTTHPGCHCPPTSIGTPPTHLLALCHYHHSSPINSKSIFHSKPCQNRHTFENFRFFMHWACTHYAITWGNYFHAFAHLSTPLHALSAPSMHLPHTLLLLFALHFLPLPPLSPFHSPSSPFTAPCPPIPIAFHAT